MKIYLRYKLLLIKEWFENTIKKKYLDRRKYKLFKKKYKNELNALTKNVLSIALSNIRVSDQDFIEMILSKHFKYILFHKCFICHNRDIYDNEILTLVMRLK